MMVITGARRAAPDHCRRRSPRPLTPAACAVWLARRRLYEWGGGPAGRSDVRNPAAAWAAVPRMLGVADWAAEAGREATARLRLRRRQWVRRRAGSAAQTRRDAGRRRRQRRSPPAARTVGGSNGPADHMVAGMPLKGAKGTLSTPCCRNGDQSIEARRRFCCTGKRMHRSKLRRVIPKESKAGRLARFAVRLKRRPCARTSSCSTAAESLLNATLRSNNPPPACPPRHVPVHSPPGPGCMLAAPPAPGRKLANICAGPRARGAAAGVTRWLGGLPALTALHGMGPAWHGPSQRWWAATVARGGRQWRGWRGGRGPGLGTSPGRGRHVDDHVPPRLRPLPRPRWRTKRRHRHRNRLIVGRVIAPGRFLGRSTQLGADAEPAPVHAPRPLSMPLCPLSEPGPCGAPPTGAAWAWAKAHVCPVWARWGRASRF